MNGFNEDFLESKTTERSERAKKVYRYVTDVARRLGDATTGCRGIADLFTTAIETQRQKLRDNCEKLFFLDPLTYGKKSLELLWRKVYYDTIGAAKKLRETDKSYDNYLFTHIMSGIGQFHNLITKIKSEMNVDLKELDFLPSYYGEDDEDTAIKEASEEENQFYKSTIYSCLIYLGDLNRYQVEIFNTFESSIAARYYLQASQLDLTSGMPFNQLGNLYLGKNYNLDSVCYYIHCLSTISPFDGAVGNLTKIFEKNSQYCDLLDSAETLTQTEHMQVTIANFLSLIEIWYLDKEDSDIPKICSAIAHQLKIAINFTKAPLPDINKNYTEYTQALEEETLNPSFMNSTLIHNVVKICLLTVSKLNETNETKAFACKAFTLALLSQLLQKLLKQVESMGLKNPAHKYTPKYLQKNTGDQAVDIDKKEDSHSEDSIVTNGNVNDNENSEKGNESDHNHKTELNGDTKNNKKTPTKRRRRRRAASSESSDMSDADTESSIIETDKSCSDEDDLSDSTYKSEDESKSEGSLSDCFNDEELDLPNGDNDNETKTNPIGSKNNVQSNGQEETVEASNNVDQIKLDPKALEHFLMNDNILPSIKLLQDWVLTEKDLILSCGESGETLFQCVVDLLNIFTHYFNIPNDSESEEKIILYVKYIAKKFNLEYKSLPLTEDINLRGTNICKFDKGAAEWQIMTKFKPQPIEENVMRILHFIDFGYQISKIIQRIRFNRYMKIYYFKKVLPPKVNTKLSHKRSREWHNTKKQENADGGLLRRLGRLWLTSQVRELERTEQVDIPTLLAVDTATLHEHLRRVKQLLRTRNFIFLIPSVVLQELDELKRERSSARDAIRWLEIQLKSGSRFLRTQRPGQSKPLSLLKYPRKAPQNVHNFIQILEFCNHFISNEKHGGNDIDNSLHGKSPFLILLVGNEGKSEEQYKEFSVTGAAQAAGVSVEYVGDFYTKWRQAIQKTGKKR